MKPDQGTNGRRAVLAAVLCGVVFCLYLLAHLLIMHHFEAIAHRYYDMWLYYVVALPLDLLGAALLRAGLAFSRRGCRGRLRLDIPALAAFLVVLAGGALFAASPATLNIVFSSLYRIPLFFLLLCGLRRGPDTAAN